MGEVEMHRYPDVWQAVVNERARRQMTTDELARRSGIPVGTVRAYLQGRITPTYPRVIALARALGIDVQASVTHGLLTDEGARLDARAAA